MRHFLPTATALAVTAASLAFIAPASAQTADGSAGRVKTPTKFALKAAGYGTRVEGGMLPAGSGTTGYQVIGCTNKAGIVRKNYEALATLPGLGKVESVKTRTWTKIRPEKDEVSVYSMHSVAKVVLGGQLEITAVNSLSRAFHNRSGFHTETTTSIGGISVAGQSFPIPTPDQPLTIPGLATIAIGDHHERSDKKSAYASANAVRIELIPTATRVRIAHSAARMGGGVTIGLFKGQSNGTQVRALDDLVKSGPTPLSYIPCQGTDGEIRTKSLASVDLAGQIVVGAVENRQMGKQTKARAQGFEESRIASINLGNQLVVNAIKARANVTRLAGGRVIRNINGTSIGEIIVNGSPQAIPDPGQAIKIPGVLSLETNVITKTKQGIDVVAVRITLLDGTGAVVDLGHARLAIKKSGIKN